jgi:hypothetical protein
VIAVRVSGPDAVEIDRNGRVFVLSFAEVYGAAHVLREHLLSITPPGIHDAPAGESDTERKARIAAEFVAKYGQEIDCALDMALESGDFGCGDEEENEARATNLAFKCFCAAIKGA